MKTPEIINGITQKNTKLKNLEPAWNKLIREYKTSKTKELRYEIFKLVDPIFKKNSSGGVFHSSEDIYQEKMLSLFTLLENIENSKNPFQDLMTIINKKYRIDKTRKRTSLPNAPTAVKNKSIYYIDRVSEDKVLPPLSSPSNEKRMLDRDYIDSLGIDEEKLKMIKEYFGIESAKKTYKEIGAQKGVSSTTVRQKIQSAIFKEQLKYDGLSEDDLYCLEEFKKQILSKHFSAKEADEIAKNVITKNIILLHHPIEKTKDNIFGLVSRFEKEKLSPKEYLNAAIKLPQIFSLKPDHVENNIRSLVSRFEKEGLTTKDYLKSALKRPVLFTLKPDTVEKNIRNFVEMHQNDGLTTDQYIKAAVRQPALFYYSPQTVEKRVQSVVKRFEKDGLTTQRYLKAIINTPVLLSLSPDTIEKNVKNFVPRFEKDGLTVSAYIKSAMSAPSLLYSSAETIEKRIRGFVKLYEKDGVTIQNYLKICLDTPILMMRDPETIAQNIDKIVKSFKNQGLKSQELLKMLFKRPRLMNVSSEKLIQDIKCLKFKQQSEKTLDTTKPFFEGITSIIGASTEKIKLQLLCRLILPQKDRVGMGFNVIKDSMPAYLKAHPEKTYDIKIPENEMTQDFIDFVKNFSIKVLGKNVFNIEVVK